MRPYAFSAVLPEQIETGIREYRETGAAPSLAIVFSSVDHRPETIAEIFRKQDIDIFGSSTCGEIINGQIRDRSISVLLLDIKRMDYRIGVFEIVRGAEYQSGKQAGDWALSNYKKTGLLCLAVPTRIDHNENLTQFNHDLITSGIADSLGPGTPVFGGLAGNNFRENPYGKMFVYGNSAVSYNGISALAINLEAIDLKGFMVSGWKGIGTAKTVTCSEGNTVYAIDGQPALDVVKKYFNISEDMDIARIWEYGFVLQREDGSNVFRVLTLINPDKSISSTGAIPQGAKIRFSMAPGEQVLDLAIENLRRFHKEIPETGAIILFNCAARLMAFGRSAEKETAEISNLWKVPSAGLFTYGEYGPAETGRCDLHNYTLSMAMLNDRK